MGPAHGLAGPVCFLVEDGWLGKAKDRTSRKARVRLPYILSIPLPFFIPDHPVFFLSATCDIYSVIPIVKLLGLECIMPFVLYAYALI